MKMRKSRDLVALGPWDAININYVEIKHEKREAPSPPTTSRVGRVRPEIEPGSIM